MMLKQDEVNNLILDNYGLIKYYLIKRKNILKFSEDDLEDLIQESIIDLMKRLKTYDPLKGTLSTYMVRSINFTVRQWFHKQAKQNPTDDKPIRINCRLSPKGPTLRLALPEEWDQLDITEKMGTSVINDPALCYNITPESDVMNNVGGLYYNKLLDTIVSILKSYKFGDTQIDIYKTYVSNDSDKKLSYSEIGEKYNVSKQYVHQVINKVKYCLKNSYRLKRFLEGMNDRFNTK